MQRFYLSPLFQKEAELILNDPRLLHQTHKVLRMKAGDFFHAFNEKEGEFLFKIESLDRKRLVAKRIQAVENLNEPRLEVSLYQALPKKPALFEMIVQKATEIGVSHIYPLITERTENRRLAKRERLQSIAMEAAEQCGRLILPEIHHPVLFQDILPTLPHAYMAYELEQENDLQNLEPKLHQKPTLQLIIGPEGGFSQKEIHLAQSHKIQSFTLGPRILRMETAAICALSLILLRRET